MATFQLVLALLLVGIVLSIAAPRIGVPWPAMLAVGGAALAFVPDMPAVALDPRLALALFVAPILLDAAYDASPRDLRDNWVPVSSLVLIAVSLTVAAVAIVARAMVPDMPWPAAIALGAIVAPPDAAAAVSVLRGAGLPHRLRIILEGESLLNDASALLIYRVAVGAMAGGITVWTGPLLLLSAAGGVLLGVVLAHGYMLLARRLPRGPETVLLQFLGTFGVWLLADALHLSAILTVVAYALTIARVAPAQTDARGRRSSYAVWEVVVFVMTLLAFILVGLQLRAIMQRLGGQGWAAAAFAAAVLGTTIGVRIVWVMSFNTALRWKNARFGASGPHTLLPTVQGGVAIAWCGMRGVVTLAAALALPADFPHRDLILFAAFCVVLGTLVVQGTTLKPMLARLNMPQDDRMRTELALARAEAARAALDALKDDDTETGRLLARKYEARLERADAGDTDAGAISPLRRKALAAERRRLLALRREGRIGDDAFHEVEEELDWAEAE